MVQDEVKNILKKLGENPDRDGLRDTPRRVEESLKFLTQGYNLKLDEVIGDALFEGDHHEMVIVKDIEIYSLCEHHLLPFVGKAHVGYIPSGRVVGLSKIVRVVDMYARRLQLQKGLPKKSPMHSRKASSRLGWQS